MARMDKLTKSGNGGRGQLDLLNQTEVFSRSESQTFAYLLSELGKIKARMTILESKSPSCKTKTTPKIPTTTRPQKNLTYYLGECTPWGIKLVEAFSRMGIKTVSEASKACGHEYAYQIVRHLRGDSIFQGDNFLRAYDLLATPMGNISDRDFKKLMIASSKKHNKSGSR
jgi:hypothetical protein